MEQAHTRLIAQLNERISAADNTPLYMKFAQTVKDAVRSGILEHGNIFCPANAISASLPASRASRYEKRCRRWKKRVLSRAPAATVRKSIISLNIP